MREASWVERAECVNTDPELFYPPTDGPRSHDQIRAAQRVCQDCPVRRPCFEEALAMPVNLDHGIRAGTTARERRVLRKARQEQRAA